MVIFGEMYNYETNSLLNLFDVYSFPHYGSGGSQLFGNI